MSLTYANIPPHTSFLFGDEALHIFICNLKINAVPKHTCNCNKTAYAKVPSILHFFTFPLNRCINDLLTKYNAGAVAGRSRRTGKVTVFLHHPSWKYHSRLVVGQRLVVCNHFSSRYPVVLVLFNRGSSTCTVSKRMLHNLAIFCTNML